MCAQRAGEVEQRDLALIFVAMVAGGEQDGRAASIRDDHDGHGDGAPAAVVAGLRDAELAGLAALPGEVDLGDDRACRHFLHSPLPGGLNPAATER